MIKLNPFTLIFKKIMVEHVNCEPVTLIRYKSYYAEKINHFLKIHIAVDNMYHNTELMCYKILARLV